MKILIAGLGSIGRRHLRNLLALGERDILLYRTGRSTLPDAELAGLPVETDLSAALALRPQAAIVSNPTAFHLDVAIPAAEAGCHLFLEKPLSHSLARVEQLQKIVQRQGIQVLSGFQYRFHPGLQEVQRLLSNGAIGRPLSARVHWGEYLPDWHPWEDYLQGFSARSDLGGGVILTLCHPFDYLRWLLGEVSCLWAFTGQISGLGLEVEDTAEIGLRFHSGALASIHLDYFQRPHVHALEISGTGGMLRWDYTAGELRVYRVQAEDQPGTWEVSLTPNNAERNLMFLAEMRHFLALVRGETSPLCTLEDGLRTLELALGALESGRQEKMIYF